MSFSSFWVPLIRRTARLAALALPKFIRRRRGRTGLPNSSKSISTPAAVVAPITAARPPALPATRRAIWVPVRISAGICEKMLICWIPCGAWAVGARVTKRVPCAPALINPPLCAGAARATGAGGPTNPTPGRGLLARPRAGARRRTLPTALAAVRAARTPRTATAANGPTTGIVAITAGATNFTALRTSFLSPENKLTHGPRPS